MKHLVKLDQPCDYHFRGRTVYFNPDDVKSVYRGDRYATVVMLHCGDSYVTDTPMDEVVKAVNEAL